MFSQNLFLSNSNQLEKTAFMNAVIDANYDAVKAKVKQHPALIFEMVKINSGETISPLQYAFKVYDTYMWRIFFDAVKNDKDLLARFNGQLSQSIQHIDLTLLFDAYDHFVALCENKATSIEERTLAFTKLGEAQNLLPQHMLQTFFYSKEWNKNVVFDAHRNPCSVQPICYVVPYYKNTKHCSIHREALDHEKLGKPYTLHRHYDDVLACSQFKPLFAKHVFRKDANAFRKLLNTRRTELSVLKFMCALGQFHQIDKAEPPRIRA